MGIEEENIEIEPVHRTNKEKEEQWEDRKVQNDSVLFPKLQGQGKYLEECEKVDGDE